MKYSVVKRINGEPDMVLCIEAVGRKEAIEKARLERGKTISVTKWWEAQDKK